MQPNARDVPPPNPVTQPVPQIAGMLSRMLAFLMDIALLAALSVFLLLKVLLPAEHPKGIQDVMSAAETYMEGVQAAELSGEQPPPFPDLTGNPHVNEMAQYAMSALLFITMGYFTLMEVCLRGATLGKRTFRLRTINADTGLPCGIFDHFLRSMIKTVTLLAVIPFLWFSYLTPLFNKNRSAGHDYVSRTVVIAE